MARAHPVTSHDVARKAGVSRATVSYVLNGAEHQRVSPATRARVLSVARQLGYSPNAAALALRTGHSDIVLVSLPPWPHGPVIVDAIDAAVTALRGYGYTPLVHFEQPDEATDPLADTCRRIQPVGLVAPGGRVTRRFVTQLRRNRTKGIVAIDGRPLGYVPTVVVRQAALGEAAVGFLTGRGHRRLLAVTPSDPDLAELRDSRLAGARDAAKAAGAKLADVQCRLDVAAIGTALDGALAARWPPTAIYTFNDDFAMFTVRALLDRGVDVPGGVAVIGCDDVVTAQLVRPALTTVRIDGRAFGDTLAIALHAAIAGTDAPNAVDFLVPEVIERDSA